VCRVFCRNARDFAPKEPLGQFGAVISRICIPRAGSHVLDAKERFNFSRTRYATFAQQPAD